MFYSDNINSNYLFFLPGPRIFYFQKIHISAIMCFVDNTGLILCSIDIVLSHLEDFVKCSSEGSKKRKKANFLKSIDTLTLYFPKKDCINSLETFKCEIKLKF